MKFALVNSFIEIIPAIIVFTLGALLAVASVTWIWRRLKALIKNPEFELLARDEFKDMSDLAKKEISLVLSSDKSMFHTKFDEKLLDTLPEGSLESAKSTIRKKYKIFFERYDAECKIRSRRKPFVVLFGCFLSILVWLGVSFFTLFVGNQVSSDFTQSAYSSDARPDKIDNQNISRLEVISRKFEASDELTLKELRELAQETPKIIETITIDLQERSDRNKTLKVELEKENELLKKTQKLNAQLNSLSEGQIEAIKNLVTRDSNKTSFFVLLISLVLSVPIGLMINIVSTKINSYLKEGSEKPNLSIERILNSDDADVQVVEKHLMVDGLKD